MNENKEIVSNSKKDETIGYSLGSKGGDYPIVEINGYNLTKRQVTYFEINTDGFLPSVICSFKISDGIFISNHFPKDGDLVSTFIRSYSKDLKPIRADFLINNVTTSKTADSQGSRLKITVYGELYVPKLYATFNKAYPDMTSLEVMSEVVNELGLGLVTNLEDIETKDKMTWISPNTTYLEFIQYVTNYSYLDEYSFFNCWIDFYYNLNFVDMNRMFTIADSEDTSDGLSFTKLSNDFDVNRQIDYLKDRNVLTNMQGTNHGNNFIHKHEFINKSGKINKEMGYINNVNFFDFELGKLVNFNIEATITDSTDKKIALKGRPHELTYKDEVKKLWDGWSYVRDKHNVHEFFKEAYYQNVINNKQIEKLMIKVYLEQANLNYYQGQRVPMIFVNTDDEQRIKDSGYSVDKADEVGFTVDRFLSGNYIIKGINLKYKKDTMQVSKVTQEMLMMRREWTHPKITDKND